MVGFYAIGDPTEPIRLDLDRELEGSHITSSVPSLPWLDLLLDARWYTKAEVLAVLEHKEGTNFTRGDYKQLARAIDERVNNKVSFSDPLGGDAAVHDSQIKGTPGLVVHDSNEPPFRIPPRTAIAGVLISDWVFGKARERM